MSKKSPQRGSIKTRSQISCSSKQSGSSSASKTAAALARAKAEAAFAGEEIALKLQQAELEASTQLQRTRLEVCLDKVRVEKKAAAAEAKAEVLEAALMQDSDEVLSQIDVPNDDPEKRTKEYVEGAFQGTNTPDEAFVDAHTSNVDLQAIQPTLTIDSHQRISGPGIKLPGKSSAALKTTIHTLTAQSQNKTMVDGIKGNLAKQAEQCSTVPKMEQNTCYTEHPLDSPYGGEGYRDRFDNSHLSYKGVQPTQGDGSKDMSDLVRFIARRELVSTGLTHFNDRPECFRAWKSSFLNAIRDLNLSSSEHLDLLVKWLGKDSAEHARRIRTVHVNYPEYGLRAVWDRLNEYYGAPEIIENSLFKRLESFPKIPNKDYHKLRELGDLLMEIQAAKEDGDLLGLSYLDTPRGVNPVVQKLPFYLQEKWLTIGFQYKQDYKVFYPPFSLFVDFVCNQARMRSDPSFMLAAFSNDSTEHGRQMLKTDGQRAFAVLKTGVSSKTFSAHHSGPSVQTNASPTSKFTTTADPSKHCLLHDKPHPLSKCRGFRGKPIDERKSILKKHGICYKCCRALHLARNCEEDIICAECGSKTHVTALHPEPAPWLSCPDTPTPENGGEKDNNQGAAVSTTCTEICGKEKSGRSCSKVCLVRVFPAGCPDAAVKMYVILDDQSNRSLARSEFFDLFDISGLPTPYFLKTCAGTMETEGRQASGFVVEPVDRSIQLSLPTLIECNEIPNNRSEIPTPEVALGHGHLKHLTKHIPKLDQQAPIALLLGRDIIRVHKVRRQVNGPHNAPFAQKLDLGWVIVGDVCIGDVHKPPVVSSYYTNILRNGRPSLFEPCPRSYIVKEKYCGHGPPSVPLLNKGCSTSGVQSFSDSDVFQQTKDDDSEAPSIEDIQFLVIMDREVHQDEGNNWVAPLPFRSQRQRLPDNRAQALERFFSLQRTFRKKPEMKEQFLAFMEKIFQNGHAEPAPLLQPGEEHWYLPCFGVYHPKKPSQIRVVFDSSAQHKGLSLNQVLLTGPDLNNNLIGVLLRFRKEPIAFTVDIQQMFHCFVVRPEDRNFLRFLWFKDNNPEKDIEEFRMKVHVFGNSPSPAVAIYCLRRAAELGQRDFGEDARQFVVRDFYVDDGLKSLPTPDAAISLLKRTQEMLACSNLRLHKLASNSKEVMEAFPCDDHATNLKDLDLDSGNLPTQRSLGLLWDLDSDSFMYQVQDERKPFTRRGILSTVNSLYDPLGFVSPITIEGKALLRELTADSPDWDAPLPSEKEKLWEGWRDSLQELQHFKIPRSYTHVPPSAAKKTELCIFSDASERAVAAVAYLKTVDADENCYTGLVASKAKLAPRPGYTIPRLELCAAVMAVNLAEVITSEMDTTFDAVTFFTDSKVVLGYIYNEKRRFHVFVHNRVQRIRRSTLPQQWRYVRTENNPADIATRPIPAERLKDTVWFTGPAFLSQPRDRLPDDQTFELLEPECDPEIKPQVTTLLTAVTQHLGSQRFSHFSCWMTLVRAVGALIHIIQGFKKEQGETSEDCKGWHWCPRHLSGDVLSQSTTVILRTVQHETYGKELELLASNKSIPKNSLLWSLDPFIDQNGLLRVGGRLNRASLGSDEKKPLILPGRHHVATLIARHFHKETQHQGRHFTEGAIRAAGYWILGGKRCVSKLIFECVTCRRLRKKCEVQKMADLPPDRLSMEPPFSNVGLDVFGPWSVSARRTRGGHAESKRWAVLFTCLSVRAIHIEVIESLDSSSFINAFRRFLAIRGPVKHIRSDRGTNFIGASKALGIPSNANGEAVEKFLSEQGCSWTFNPPHSSHMGGVWERMIGVTRRILDSMFLQMGSSKLTHEVLITFLAEVTAIVNNRPLVPVSTDPMDPFILTPATLLTQKAGPCPVPTEEFGDKVLFRQQWRRVQSLSNTFWDRWRKQYLSTLQTRKKWTCEQPSLKPGNVVLLRDNQSKRNDWPLGIVTEVYPSKDGHVRKVQVQVTKKDGKKLFLRPVSDIVLLISSDA